MATPGSSEAEPRLSLLWPPGSSHDPAWQLPREVIQDLGLATIVAAMAPAPAHREALEAVLFTFCPHPAVIAYRQDVLDDLLATPGLAEALGALLPALDELALFTTRPASNESSLQEVTRRAGELELLVGCIEQLAAAFDAAPRDLHSAGLTALRSYVEVRRADSAFQRLATALPGLLTELRASASVTIGVNLDPYLRPEEALLLTVHPTRFTESGLLARLFGTASAQGRGIGPLHTLPMLTESSGRCAKRHRQMAHRALAEALTGVGALACPPGRRARLSHPLGTRPSGSPLLPIDIEGSVVYIPTLLPPPPRQARQQLAPCQLHRRRTVGGHPDEGHVG